MYLADDVSSLRGIVRTSEGRLDEIGCVPTEVSCSGGRSAHARNDLRYFIAGEASFHCEWDELGDIPLSKPVGAHGKVDAVDPRLRISCER